MDFSFSLSIYYTASVRFIDVRVISLFCDLPQMNDTRAKTSATFTGLPAIPALHDNVQPHLSSVATSGGLCPAPRNTAPQR